VCKEELGPGGVRWRAEAKLAWAQKLELSRPGELELRAGERGLVVLWAREADAAAVGGAVPGRAAAGGAVVKLEEERRGWRWFAVAGRPAGAGAQHGVGARERAGRCACAVRRGGQHRAGLAAGQGHLGVSCSEAGRARLMRTERSDAGQRQRDGGSRSSIELRAGFSQFGAGFFQLGLFREILLVKFFVLGRNSESKSSIPREIRGIGARKFVAM
jgi:hypothetical protein